MKKLLSILLAVFMLVGFAGLVPAMATQANPFAPPANLDQLNAQQQLDYFNLVVNRVRAERPGFAQRSRLHIEDMQLSGAASVAMPIINVIMRTLIPGNWWYNEIREGASNVDWFMSHNTNASDLRLQDTIAIVTERDGNNWVMEVLVREETNPVPGLGSSIGRIAPVMIREQVIDEITSVSDAITANPNDMTLRYHNVFASVVVNPQGQVIAASNGFHVHAQANNVTIGPLTTDLTVSQSSQWQYAYFSWSDCGTGFPPDSNLPALRWWQHLPAWLQFILRWFAFGWIWM